MEAKLLPGQLVTLLYTAPEVGHDLVLVAEVTSSEPTSCYLTDPEGLAKLKSEMKFVPWSGSVRRTRHLLLAALAHCQARQVRLVIENHSLACQARCELRHFPLRMVLP